MNNAVEIVKNIHGIKLLYVSSNFKEIFNTLNRIIFEIENKYTPTLDDLQILETAKNDNVFFAKLTNNK